MAQVITYQLAYLSNRSVSLCADCVARDDHDCGSLGSVQHGLHDGECEGASHGAPDLVLVETMPAHLRGSHRAARNWGVYPHNGSERRIMSRSDAEAAVDGDEYDHVVRDATESDLAKYEVAS
jgi:hypothetical protein